MAILAYVLLLLAFLCSIGGAAWVLILLWQDDHDSSILPEYAHIAQSICMVLASGILLLALINSDFSLVYVASYTDRLLPLFYRITAFWAGQAGSMLFWALSVAIAGLIFQILPVYKKLFPRTRLWYWLFYLGIMAFFGLILTTWNNPFLIFDQAPADGNGLNPLLQNPGMIFHPPLLFWGYGGFAIPSCLALAQAMHKQAGEANWSDVVRPFILLSWLFLTAGIVLGGWWSYMELGWGGYWAWDPVENASLIPWLVATAALHTLIIQSRRQKLQRANIFLMALTTISAFFATYLVRSGVVQSLHAFGDGGVGTPLLIFILLSTVICLVCAFSSPAEDRPLEGIETREGFLVLTAWLFLAISIIILVATLWPVISIFWQEFIMGSKVAPVLDAAGHDHGGAQGLTATFYNRVCLPLFTALVAMLAFCPWLGFNGGIRNFRKFSTVLGVFIVSCAAFWAMGYTMPVAMLGMGAGIAACTSTVMILCDKKTWLHMPSLSAYGVHLGLALMALGIAFSGPYKVEREVVLSQGQQVDVGIFQVKLNKVQEGNTQNYAYVMAELSVSKKDSQPVISKPERRLYHKWNRQAFAEADVIPSLGSEFYASLLAVDNDGRATLRLSANPLVNWIWIGGLLMCLFPLVGLKRRKE